MDTIDFELVEDDIPSRKRLKLDSENENASKLQARKRRKENNTSPINGNGDGEDQVEDTLNVSTTKSESESSGSEVDNDNDNEEEETIDNDCIDIDIDDNVEDIEKGEKSDQEIELDSSTGANKVPPDKKKKKNVIKKGSKVKVKDSKVKVKVKRTKKGKKTANMRRNIKDILTTDELLEDTKRAQREEAERLQRMKMNQLNFQAQNHEPITDIDITLDDLDFDFETLSEQINQKCIPVSIAPGSSADSIRIVQPQQPILEKKPEQEEQDKLQKKAEIHEEIVLSSDSESEDEAEQNQNEEFFLNKNNNRLGSYLIKEVMPDTDQVCQVRKDIDGDVGDKIDHLGGQSDDDDCIVLSPSECVEVEPEIDEDKNNIPDLNGRILINVGHPTDEEPIYLRESISKVVKPHQIGGIRFLYENIIESISRFNESRGFGCILAHSMGLGKTLQTISFCDIFLENTPGRCILVIVPINTVQNWLNEFNSWLPHKTTKPKPKKPTKISDIFKKKSSTSSASTSSVNTDICMDIDEKTMNNDSINSKSSSTSSTEEKIKINCAVPEDIDFELPDISDDIILISKVEKNDNKEVVSDSDSKSNLNLSESSTSSNRFRSFEIFLLNETVKTLKAREKIITDWSTKGGVLLIGYEMYRLLASRKVKKSTKKSSLFQSSNPYSEEISLERIYTSLVSPGPDLVICDEGHRIKNSSASISKALKEIETKRRIVLTGYPLQNNLLEYWCMVDFVRPNYLGTKQEFCNMFERPINNGQCLDSTNSDKKIMRERSYVLYTLLEGFVQRRSYKVLLSDLPSKEEWVFLVKMTPIQVQLYNNFIDYLRERVEYTTASSANPIKAFAVCCKIWNHSDVLFNLINKKKVPLGGGSSDDLAILDDLDIEEVRLKNNQNQNSSNSNSSNNSYGGNARENSSFSSFSLDWAKIVFDKNSYQSNRIENGIKFELFMNILLETISIKEKLLVFTQSLLTLDLMELFLDQELGWTNGKQYFRLDGSTTGLEREKLIGEFNDNEHTKLFIVSTRAGSLGINLIGANRVIIFDASWNPCHDTQAVCRIYRYGQKKKCQIYRFVTDGTLEKRIYDRQINKQGMSARIIDEHNPDSHLSTKDLSSYLSFPKSHETVQALQAIQVDHNMDNFEDIVLRNTLKNCGDKLTTEPFQHESLLVDRKDKKLSASEKRIAKKSYDMEKAGAIGGYNRPSYSSYYPKNDYNSTTQTISAASSNYYNHYRQNLANANYNNSTSSIPNQIKVLAERGIMCQPFILKRDGFLADPHGGPDIYIQKGDQIYIIRSIKGVYFRLSNGKLVAVRSSANNIDFSRTLSDDELSRLVYSIIKVPSQLLAQQQLRNQYNTNTSNIPGYQKRISRVPSNHNHNHPQPYSNNSNISTSISSSSLGGLDNNFNMTNYSSSSGGYVQIHNLKSTLNHNPNRHITDYGIGPPSHISTSSSSMNPFHKPTIINSNRHIPSLTSTNTIFPKNFFNPNSSSSFSNLSSKGNSATHTTGISSERFILPRSASTPTTTNTLNQNQNISNYRHHHHQNQNQNNENHEKSNGTSFLDMYLNSNSNSNSNGSSGSGGRNEIPLASFANINSYSMPTSLSTSFSSNSASTGGGGGSANNSCRFQVGDEKDDVIEIINITKSNKLATIAPSSSIKPDITLSEIIPVSEKSNNSENNFNKSNSNLICENATSKSASISSTSSGSEECLFDILSRDD